MSCPVLSQVYGFSEVTLGGSSVSTLGETVRCSVPSVVYGQVPHAVLPIQKQWGSFRALSFELHVDGP